MIKSIVLAHMCAASICAHADVLLQKHDTQCLQLKPSPQVISQVLHLNNTTTSKYEACVNYKAVQLKILRLDEDYISLRLDDNLYRMDIPRRQVSAGNNLNLGKLLSHYDAVSARENKLNIDYQTLDGYTDLSGHK